MASACARKEFTHCQANLPQHHDFWERAVLVAIESNIGVGRRTLFDKFKQEIGSIRQELQDPTLELLILKEPLNTWSDNKKTSLLENYYHKPHEFANPFQSNVQLNHFKQLVCLCSDAAIADRQRRNVTTIIIMERSLHSARFIFTELAKQRGYMTAEAYKSITDLYQVTVDGYQHFPPLDGLLYLKTPVEQCWNQVMLRNRPAETAEGSSLTRDYLLDIERLHNQWLKPGPMTYSAQSGRITHINTMGFAERISIIDTADLNPTSLFVYFRHTLAGLVSSALASRPPALARKREKHQQRSSLFY